MKLLEKQNRGIQVCDRIDFKVTLFGSLIGITSATKNVLKATKAKAMNN